MEIRVQAPIRIDEQGVMRVGNTRVTMDTVIEAYRQGFSAEGIAAQYPTLELADVYGVFSYYLRNRPEVDAYLARRQDEAAAIQAEVERRFPPEGIKARLLARKAEMEKGKRDSILPVQPC